jgi:hypothetical protein
MVIFDCLKKKLRKSKETETGEKTKDALTTSPEKANIMESNVKDPSTHKWQDETSRKVEERLMEKGIRIPWHYNDTFGGSSLLRKVYSLWRKDIRSQNPAAILAKGLLGDAYLSAEENSG